ncbi:urea ABC transporter permease subunit UrtC [Streptomyces ipomoeae]|uniref:urea ABC transporter permease subunit UrtC n=1 Tax=Streptomyces ipomoeae TaxID=103232 RepID=UPI001146FAFC|nr:urea ABC transporter permease subunit UrtC [Streptomyces ipomoeae]MDX2939581.1 urea ABC transporter permease subunit UrtC [Streptomyces ipomoeae]TQE25225.1 urea ABC transporter permease subunit UrtC [Streptomyces ipomoeae]
MTTTLPPTKTTPAAQPSPSRLERFRVPGGFLLGAVLLMGVAPLVLSDFRLNLLAKYLCYAIVAVGVSLAWGRGGLLVLGQGVFFGLGGYAMAMHLKLADAAATGQTLPDFMQLYGTGDTLPWWWKPFADPAFALAMTVLLPMAVAALLGFFVFRRRVKGAYFAILSQALAAALAIWLVGQQATTGGTNGLTDIQGFFGYDLGDPANQRTVYFIIAAALLLLMAAARQLFVSRYGELLVAVRDSEERVRFLGYDPANVKLVAYVVAAGMAGLAGALFVPAVGIISPALIGIVPSIGFVIGAAVGGRASLVGAVLGAVAVAWAQSTLSDAFPAAWTYLQGLLFVVAVGFLPGGLASLASVVRRRRTPTTTTPTGGTA